jgi:hypothetical protein
MAVPHRDAGLGLGTRIVACAAATALAGFLSLALIGHVNQRSLTLGRFTAAATRLTELLADNMAGSVRFGRTAGIEAAFAGLKQSEPDLASILVRNAKGETLVTWRREGTAEDAPTASSPSGGNSATTVDVPVRQSREGEPVGTLRVLWTHHAVEAALWQAGLTRRSSRSLPCSS